MATITEDYVSFEVAKLLKDKGFNEPTIGTYNIESKNPILVERPIRAIHCEAIISAPTLQMVVKWLREVHNIDIDIEAAVGMLGVKVYIPHISTYKPLEGAPSKVRQIKRGLYYKDDDRAVIPAIQYFDSYEEAVEAALKYSLENLI